MVSDGQCAVQASGLLDGNCKRFDSSNVCVECYQGFIVSYGICKAVNPQCKTYDFTGACTSCYNGYIISGRDCVVQQSPPVPSQSDLCKRFSNNVCTECYDGYSLVNGVCVVSTALCKTTDSQSNCLSCYAGYTLQNGRCIIANNAGCAQFDSFGRCTRCAPGYFFQGGSCIQANPLCRTFDNMTGACTSCYAGYVVSGSTCIVGNDVQVDSYCSRYDQNNKCIECINRYVMKNGRCSQVSDYCKDYDRNTGGCTSCYIGFALRGGQCYKTIVVESSQKDNIQNLNFKDQGYLQTTAPSKP